MNGHRFDLMTRLLTSRRGALRAGGLGLAAAAVAPLARVAAQEATSSPLDSGDEDAEAPVFLFVQPFDAGTWAPKAGEPDVYTLTLTGAGAQTVYFSDRPDRIVGLAPTEQFLAGLGFTPENPPNAAVVAQRADGTEQEVLVIELLNPTFDADAETLTYDARVLADYGEHGLAHLAGQQQDYELGETFGAGSLFIDDCDNGWYVCYLNDGVVPATPVGQFKGRYCWNWEWLTCETCHIKRKCAEQFPDQCLGSDGSYLCH